MKAYAPRDERREGVNYYIGEFKPAVPGAQTAPQQPAAPADWDNLPF